MKFIFVFIFSISVFAEDIYKAGRWDVFSKTSNDTTMIRVLDRKDKKMLLEFENPDSAQAFEDASVIFFTKLNKEFLLTKWASGAHAQTLIIFDLSASDKKPVFQETFGWPPKIEVLKDKMTISYRIFIEESDEPQNKKMTWDPTRPKSE